MMRYITIFNVLVILGIWTTTPVRSASIPIENASFEAPVVDPNGFGAIPLVDGWMEIDIDTISSANTGVFANTDANSPDHIFNADGKQLAFLGSQTGNALQQDLISGFKFGCDYRLTVAVGVSGRFPPSAIEPLDNLELVLYYRDVNDVIDIAVKTVEASGLSSIELQDFTVELPIVQTDDAWGGKSIGIALRAAGQPGGFWDIDNVRLVESQPVSISVGNASFEAPAVDPNGFGAVPMIDGWIEIDVDVMTSTNTGVFANTDVNSPDHVTNADGSQLAFLGSQQGNALEQDLMEEYKVGCAYRLTVAVGVSGRFPPSDIEPVDTLELVFYYLDANDVVDVAHRKIEAIDLSAVELQDFSLELSTVKTDDPWSGKTIGIALRAAGQPGGFWDLDNVRLVELQPVSIPVVNASFEEPVVDPNGFGAVPFIEGWTEMDIDTLSSANTGVFANTDTGSPEHIINAEGGQLAFLGSQTGNTLQQELSEVFKAGCSYRLTVAVGVSGRFPPSAVEPVDSLELVLYYIDSNDIVDIAHRTIEAVGLSSIELQDFSLELPTIRSDDEWAGKTIGIALRAAGQPGGFWDLDNVRLVESSLD